MSEKTNKTINRRLEGIVVSDKMDKTVVVSVERFLTDRKYGKKIKSTKKYKCHDAKNEYKVGDKVVIAACRPISKDKKWRGANKLK